MFKNKKILAIIPARGGSKGLPGKNIKILVGKPLIAWTIEQAKKSKYIDKLIVNTDSKKIVEVAEKYGADVPFLRPKKLAQDDSSIYDVVFHTLNWFEKKDIQFDIIILLQTTSPLRNTGDIDNALRLFLEKCPESLISISENSPYWSFKIDKKDYLRPVFNWNYFKKRRQDLPKSYVPNGAIFIFTPKTLLKNKRLYYKETLPYVMPIERSIDIDNEVDFKLVEIIIKNEKNNNKK